MLSILIPVYNYDVTDLVTELLAQAERDQLVYEIICLNDGSSSTAPVIPNKTFAWQENTKNLGRAKTRNRLVELANYQTLLFLDADVGIPSSRFLSDYLSQKDSAQVICGGISYAQKKPDEIRRLRWNYGNKKECQPVSKRNMLPYTSFMTGNFMTSASVFDDVEFDQSLHKYGHEDTIFGKHLLESGISVLHIDNPIIHVGLETNEVFIAKTKESIQSLAHLYRTGSMTRHYSGVIKLYENLRWIGLIEVTSELVGWMEKKFATPLYNSGKRLWLFQLLKLRWFYEEQDARS